MRWNIARVQVLYLYSADTLVFIWNPQECLVSIPWKRAICTERCLFQGLTGPALRMSIHAIYSLDMTLVSSFISVVSQVIVGSNGSGKSTILKLAARIYDPTEGSIFIDGQDIKSLRLADLRRAMAILFQDYTHFPLSVRTDPYTPAQARQLV